MIPQGKHFFFPVQPKIEETHNREELRIKHLHKTFIIKSESLLFFFLHQFHYPVYLNPVKIHIILYNPSQMSFLIHLHARKNHLSTCVWCGTEKAIALLCKPQFYMVWLFYLNSCCYSCSQIT
jgi:hypothetical protein